MRPTYWSKIARLAAGWWNFYRFFPLFALTSVSSRRISFHSHPPCPHTFLTTQKMPKRHMPYCAASIAPPWCRLFVFEKKKKRVCVLLFLNSAQRLPIARSHRIIMTCERCRTRALVYYLYKRKNELLRISFSKNTFGMCHTQNSKIFFLAGRKILFEQYFTIHICTSRLRPSVEFAGKCSCELDLQSQVRAGVSGWWLKGRVPNNNGANWRRMY